MPSITESITGVVRSLGNRGALVNATSALLQHERDEWLVDGLLVRLAAMERPETAGDELVVRATDRAS